MSITRFAGNFIKTNSIKMAVARTCMPTSNVIIHRSLLNTNSHAKYLSTKTHNHENRNDNLSVRTKVKNTFNLGRSSFLNLMYPLREIGINESYGVAAKIGRIHCVKIIENFDKELGESADLVVKLMEYTHYTSRCEHWRMQNLKIICNTRSQK